MTIFLILGAVAGLYVLALLFHLASYALPVYAGLTCAFLLLRHDVGQLGAILGGLSEGIATLRIGQSLIAFMRSPIIRTGISSEERRVGKEWVSTWRYRGSRYSTKKKTMIK